MKKTSEAAVKRILKGKSNPLDKEGFWFKDNATGKNGVTDSFCMVMYDSYTLCVSDPSDAPINVNASQLFEPFNNQFHEWYNDNRTENILVKDIIDLQKEAKKNKDEDPNWYQVKRFGICFNINLMRDVCEALDCKEVGIYYPANPLEARFYKPIVIIGSTGMGLIMPMR